MNKVLFPFFLITWFLFALMACWIVPAQAAEPQQDRPTAPPPPVGGETIQPPPPSGDDRDDPTPTRKIIYPTRTPTISPTVSATPTITPTATLTPTPTPVANLRIQIYLDANQNSAFDGGEGVDGLRILARSETWQAELATSGGLAWFAPPWDLPAGAAVQIEVPYLGWNEELRLAAPDQVTQADIPLSMPVLPLYLP